MILADTLGRCLVEAAETDGLGVSFWDGPGKSSEGLKSFVLSTWVHPGTTSGRHFGPPWRSK